MESQLLDVEKSISLGSVGIAVRPTEPVSSTEDNSQTPAVSNLSYKIRVKRYEKKMQRAKLLEETENTSASSSVPGVGTHLNFSLFESFQGKGLK